MPEVTTVAEKPHSILSASGSPRWRVCYGSTGIIQQLPPVANNSYMREGTAAHSLAENILKNRVDLSLARWIVVEGESVPITAEMVDAVMVYVDYIRDAHRRRCEIGIEMRLRLLGTDYNGLPREGTADAVIHDLYKELEIVDYKHGAGHLVNPENNYQLLDYLIGAYLALPPDLAREIQSFKMTIVQPRCPGGGIRSWTITADEFFAHMQALETDIERARTDRTLTPGDHCDNTFCPARATCPALMNHMQTQSGIRFQNALAEVVEPEYPSPIELTPDRIANIKRVAGQMRAFLDQVDELALAQALSGTEIPGHKVVAKRANRQWGDELEATARLVGVLGDNAYTMRKLVSPAQAEKELKAINGDDWRSYMPTVVIPDTGRTLVPESDPRPSILIASINDALGET